MYLENIYNITLMFNFMFDMHDLLANKNVSLEHVDSFVTTKQKSTDYIVSIPHSGLLLPTEYLSYYYVKRHPMLIGTDLFTDQVFNLKQGRQIVFGISPYLINLNRYRKGNTSQSLPKHLRQDPFESKLLSDEPLRKRAFPQTVKEKLIMYYDKYHAQLSEFIDQMKQEQGFALVLDGHSMNSKGLTNTPDEGKRRPDFAVGTVHDTSADPKIIDIFCDALTQESKKEGLTVKKNDPYTGGYITKRYGNPKENVHAIQVEVKKSIFMHEGIGENDKDKSFMAKSDGLNTVNKILEKTMEVTSKEAQILFNS